MPYLAVTLPLFMLVVAVFEIRHRLTAQTGVLNFSKCKTGLTMTVAQFDSEVKAGRNLVTIDNLVLDIGSFALVHPGGKFSLQQTIGRDISKYFYGGYSMLSDAGKNRAHVHSLKALEIAQEMVIATLAGQEEFNAPVKTQLVKKVINNSDSSTFYFETLDEAPIPNFRLWHESVDMIGKHYLISAQSEPTLMRQYTICNTMNNEFYRELFELCEAAIAGREYNFSPAWFNPDPHNRLVLTLKNYFNAKGLSRLLHS